jgi:hypothetical protein
VSGTFLDSLLGEPTAAARPSSAGDFIVTRLLRESLLPDDTILHFDSPAFANSRPFADTQPSALPTTPGRSPPLTVARPSSSRRLTETISEASIDPGAGAGGGDPGSETSVGLVVGVVLAVLLLLAAAIIFLIYWRHRQSTEGKVNEYETEVEHQADTVEYAQTETITFEDAFDNPLSAVGVSEDSGGVFIVKPEEGLY